MATKVFADEISQHLDKVPPIALNRPTAAALEFDRIQIEDFIGKFAFDRRGKDIAVDYLGSGGRRIPIGVLGRELINKESKANLQSGSNLLKGKLSRGLSENILEIHVQSLIDHQPVARIGRLGALRDRGELIPLPQQSIPLERHDPAVSSVGAASLRGQTLRERNENRRYSPTAGELRQLYDAAEIAEDIAKMAELKSLGTLLNDVYPDGDRAPDGFSHWVVEIPVSDAFYYPSSGELRTAYALQSISGKTKDLDRIKELGNALNGFYPDGNRAPDDFTSLKVGITTVGSLI